MNEAELRKEMERLSKEYEPRSKLWEEYEVNLLRDYYGKIPYGRIAELLGRTPGSVTNKAAHMGLTGRGA